MVCRYQISQYSGRAGLEELREGGEIVAAFGFHDEVAVEVYKVRNIIQNYGIPCHKTATILSILHIKSGIQHFKKIEKR